MQQFYKKSTVDEVTVTAQKLEGGTPLLTFINKNVTTGEAVVTQISGHEVEDFARYLHDTLGL